MAFVKAPGPLRPDHHAQIQEQRFVVTGIGRDKVRGWFRGPVRDAASLARRFNDFCPDIVRQGTQSVGRLEVEIRESGCLFCWWD